MDPSLPLIHQQDWVFLNQIDKDEYAYFDRFTRGFVQPGLQGRTSEERRRRRSRSASEKILFQIFSSMLEERPALLKKHPLLRNPQSVKQMVAAYLDNHERESARMRKGLERFKREALVCFDATHPRGEYDWITRRTSKDSLRMILVRYMSDRFFVRHVDFEPTDLPSLINDALVWSCKEPLRILGWLAKEGRWGATSKFAHLVVPEMQRINNLVTEHPDSVVSYSRTLKAWPVFKSPHKDYDVNHEKLLDLLQVGIGHPYKIDKTAKWNANDAIARWANHLCTSIEISMDGESITKSSPPWKKQLLGLRPFGAATWEDWWQVAKHVLMDDYVDVVKIPELSRTVKAASDRKSPGRIRKRIYEKLRDRLKSMAGENKV